MPGSWPNSQDYNEAVQNPGFSFSDPELQRAQAVTNTLGLPQAFSGGFADVYQLRAADGQSWAVKCFTKRVESRRERYAAISAHLQQAGLPFIVGFDFVEQGIRIQGEWYPVLKMDWVEGHTLANFVRDNLSKPKLLKSLLQIWLKVEPRLHRAQLAHGDLQHGNVMLIPGRTEDKLSLKLIDYDGLWVSALNEQPSGEVGHPSYQHPERLQHGTYSGDVDRFPHFVIATALRCLASSSGARLWETYDTGENLLFSQSDFKRPADSAVLQELWESGRRDQQAWVGHLVLASQSPLEATPRLSTLAPDGKITALSADDEETIRQCLGLSSEQLRVLGPSDLESGDGGVDDDAVDATRDSSESMPDWLDQEDLSSDEEQHAAEVDSADWETYESEDDDYDSTSDDVDGAYEPLRKRKHRKNPPQGRVPKRYSRTTLMWAAYASVLVLGVLAFVIPWGSLVSPNNDTVPESPVAPASGPANVAEVPDRPTSAEDQTAPIASTSLAEGTPPGADLGDNGLPTKLSEPSRYPLASTLTNSIGMTLQLIPAGEFMMGSSDSDSDAEPDEKPQHQVKITRPFYMAAHEVTLGQFRRFVTDTGYQTEPEKDGEGGSGWDLSTGQYVPPRHPKYNWRTTGFPVDDTHPVVNVSWNDAVAFCEWLSRKDGYECRLPTEAEWEYACRAGSETVYYNGNDREDGLARVANLLDGTARAQWANYPKWRYISAQDGHVFTASVGRYQSNDWGLFDMHGNVLEWCSDRYDSDYYGNSPPTDPQGAETGLNRVGRGGGWGNPSVECRSAYRREFSQSDRGSGTGFRIAVTARTINQPILAGQPTISSAPEKVEELATLTGHTELVQSVAFSSDSETLVSGSVDKTIKLWDVRTEKEKRALTGHDLPLRSVVFSVDGTMLASASSSTTETIKLWDVPTWQERSTLNGHIRWGANSVAFSPDGRTLASGSDDHTIKVWDVATGQEQTTLSAHGYDVECVAFSPDGETLVSSGDQGIIKLWDTRTWKELKTLSGHGRYYVRCVAFSPDGKIVASGSEDKTIKQWDAQTGQLRATLTGHTDTVWSVAFSPNGKTLASGSWDKTIKLWDVETEEELVTLSGHKGQLYCVTFSRDGRLLASGSEDKTIKLWSVPGSLSPKRVLPQTLTNSIGMKLRLIPAGEFMMGSPNSDADAQYGEKPQHRVRITKPFHLQTTEVTQGQWEATMGTTPWKGKNAVPEGPGYPATFVNWYDAVEFCRGLSTKDGREYRLPTEAEWEYACRAGSTTIYSFGDSSLPLKDYAWFSDNAHKIGESYAHPVGVKRPNAWGMYDMYGNVWEWCADWHDVSYYAKSAESDPLNPGKGSYHMLRGGGWLADARIARSAFRSGHDPDDRTAAVGFRCVAAVPLGAIEMAPDASVAPQSTVASDPAVSPTQLEVGTRAGEESSGNTLKMKLVWCPPGSFTMGSPPDEPRRNPNEDQVKVTLTQGFWLGKYEVTQREWREVMGTEPWKGQQNVKEGDRVAATFVSWDDVSVFCRKLTVSERKSGRLSADGKYTLPTEAQWEYACRSGTTTAYSFGDSGSALSDYAWWGGVNGNGNARVEPYAHAVGLKRPNRWNLHDMHGNVWEWCRDWSDGANPPGGTDPPGPSSGSIRVSRGGSWGNAPRFVRSAYRDGDSPGYRHGNVGFRVLRSSIK